MMLDKYIKIYFAGKVDKDSSFNKVEWRDDICNEIYKTVGLKINNLDPTKYPLDENNAKLIFGRDSFLIANSDLVVVYLTDDISVGGSQEMLIAKYYGKPLIGIIPDNSKFRGTKKIGERIWKNWAHPFIKITCDYIVEDIDGLGRLLISNAFYKNKIKDISIINKTADYYYQTGLYINYLDNPGKEQKFIAQKVLVTDKDKGLLVIKYRNNQGVSKKVRGKYGLPGGKLFGNVENLDMSMIKRVKEETGIEIKPTNEAIGSYTWNYNRNGKNNRILAIVRKALYYTGKINTPCRKTEYDLEKAYWLPLSKIRLDDFVYDERQFVQTILI